MTMTKTGNYRVIAVLTNDFGAYNHGHPSKVDETIKWSGTDLDELNRQCPPSEIWGADSLGHSEIEDGLIRYDYRFERQSDDGSWEEIDDPRRRITPVTEYERAIDEENRRLFPGDYITECSTCGYDDCQCQDDHGYDCDNCRDAGCSRCDYEYPESCSDCARWFEVELLSKEGLCTDCENYRIEEAKPRCADCDSVTVAAHGDVCSHCQEWRDEEAKPRCCACSQVHTDPTLEDGDICTECDDYWTKHFVWWRRALRRWGLLK